ncbi:MAG: S-layer homology domain-containing protein, partial [Candidatus Gracilibacteria bacterium]|nr:S-layer homology domain-containing protein [Candidatus Gracilibacteria bacterium]
LTGVTTTASDLTSTTGTPVKFGVTGKSLKFSKPVKVEINVGTSSIVYPRVKHFGGAWGIDGLTTSASATCDSNGVATPGLTANDTITPVSQIITVYTCKASDFAAATSTTSGGNGGGSSGGSSGGGGTAKDSCPTGDNSGSYYDGKCNGSTATGTTTTETVKDISLDDVKVTKDESTGKVTVTKADGTKVTFSDINNTFATAYIAKLAAKGIIAGYSDGKFKPENKASRAEYLKIVLRAMDIDYSDADTSKLTFSDVSKNSWMAKVVVKAAELKLIDTKNKNFRPDSQISRAEAMKMLLNAAGIQVTEKATSSFADVSGWAVKYIEKAKELGIANGQTVNGKVLFRPADNITRAEVSKIVVKTMELK